MAASTTYLTQAQARNLDEHAVHVLGVPSLVLMENAGRGAADILLSHAVQGPVLICCGKGNNGGDGLVLARHLHIRQIPVSILLFAESAAQLSADAQVQWNIIQKLSLPARLVTRFDQQDFENVMQKKEWIVDALLGTGTRGKVASPYAEVIECLNRNTLHVMALDLPSGMDADTGEPQGVAVKASCTVTFAAKKTGFQNPSSESYTGQVFVADIGIPVF